MTPTVSIKELRGLDGRDVILRGWMCGRRTGGGIVFLLVRDGTGTCQCVVDAGQAELFETATRIGHESSLILSGRVRLDDRAPGGFEVAVRDLRVLQDVRDYPLARHARDSAFRMANRHLWMRAPRPCAALRIRHALVRAAMGFLDEHGFVLVSSPDRFHLESACMALGKAYAFRDERAQIEIEIAFAQIDESMEWAENMFGRMVGSVLEKRREDLQGLERNPAIFKKIAPPFPRITYAQAVEILRSSGTRERLEEEAAGERAQLAKEMEELRRLEEEKAAARLGWPQDKLAQRVLDLRESVRALEHSVTRLPGIICRAGDFRPGEDFSADEESVVAGHFQRPVFVKEYPRALRDFSVKTVPENPDAVLNMELLVPGFGKILSGGQREDDLQALQKRMGEDGMSLQAWEWYLDLRRYGSVPHGGFGLMIEPAAAWLCESSSCSFPD